MELSGKILSIIFGALVFWAITLFNRLVRDKNRVLAAWSDIDVQLKRRHDLIPKLIHAVRQYADYERAVMEEVTALRTQSEISDSPDEKGKLENALGAGLHRLIAVAERYPDLKANQSFLDLQQNITEVEDHIQLSRRYYNGAVRNLNTRIDSFPDMLVAKLFGFNPREYFELDNNN